MIGAIAGDIIGSRYEGSRAKTPDFTLFHADCRFTDDTVCTLAVAKAIIERESFEKHIRGLARAYPNAGYGTLFYKWVHTDDAPPYGSWGNGAPMRVAAVGWLAQNLEEVDDLATAQASVSHNHPESIDASKAIARAIFSLSQGESPSAVEAATERDFGYDLSAIAILGRKSFDITAKGTSQTALSLALRSESWEGAIRDAALLGGDTDTLACVTGAVAEAVHGVPADITLQTKARLTPQLLAILEQFEELRVSQLKSPLDEIAH